MTRPSPAELLPAAGAVLFSVVEVLVLGPTNLVGPSWALLASSLAASGLLVWRLRRPVLVQALVVLVTASPWLFWGASQSAATLLPLAVATIAVGRYARRPVGYAGIPVSVLAIAGQLTADPLQPDVASGAGWLLLGPVLWAGGAWLRGTDELERGREAETRERTRAAVAEERVRIAQEMHDVLAHTISVMVVQAEAAADALDRDPEAARLPLRRVHTTGREALREIRRVLTVLRDEDDAVEGTATTALADLQQLVQKSRDAGLAVDLRLELVEEPPADVSRAVYRLCQETLTNVLRHAGRVPVCLEVQALQDRVLVRVDNDGPPASLGPGHGLLGMRERVEGFGGTLAAGPRSGGGFAVTAHIPVPASSP